eukprot:2620550-Pleurochrysis_carterae.AAC.3
MCKVQPLSTTKETPLRLVFLASEFDNRLRRLASNARAETDGPRAMTGAGARTRLGGCEYEVEGVDVSVVDRARGDTTQCDRAIRDRV